LEVINQMNRVAGFLIGIAFALFPTANALACTCVGAPGPACQEAWKDSVGAVFLGRVVKVEGIDTNTNRVTIEIEETYRGVSGKSVQVFTSSSESSCGYPFQQGERYLVFADNAGTEFLVGLCSATKPAKYANDDITYLRSLSSLPNTARVYGTMKRYTYDPNLKPKWQPSPGEEDRATAPVAGTPVRVSAMDGDHEALVDKEGNWEVDRLPPGSYKITVKLPKNMVLQIPPGIAGRLSPKGCFRVDLRAESNGHILGRIDSEVPLHQSLLAEVEVFRAEDAEIDLLRPFGYAFRDRGSGRFDVGPLPPGNYFLAVALHNEDNNTAAVFYPGTDNPENAEIITLGDGESKSQLNFKIAKVVFREHPGCCKFAVRVPKIN
jgi:hypothetical protein